MAAAERRWSVAGVSLAVLALSRGMALLQGSRSALPQALGSRLDQLASVLGWAGRTVYRHLVAVMMPRWRARH